MDLDFQLPPELIAQKPPKERGGSRLMILDRFSSIIRIAEFSDLGQFLPPDSALVLNEAKVTPARLIGRRPNEGLAEALILNPPLPGAGPGIYDLWAMVKPGRHVLVGQTLNFAADKLSLTANVIDIDPDSGHRLLRFCFDDPPAAVLEVLGHIPLPPYIKRPDEPEDQDRYQTVYARCYGAIAAPTAGLHFTAGHLASLEREGHKLIKIFLKVGPGTFAPLTEKELNNGQLQSEDYEISLKSAEAVREAKNSGRKIVAVGTTSVRTLEWSARGGEIEAGSGQTNLFIRPGHEFKSVDSLLTNFHLPGTSLLLLVLAFSGGALIKEAYERAIEEKFRFYSYGDSMLIL
jgi:S-adenosylmethionine:tRNA ribosyltransferase-isomerase